MIRGCPGQKRVGALLSTLSSKCVSLVQRREGRKGQVSHGFCRVFMWGAKSGMEQLPPFPEPSHDAKKWKSRHPIPLCVKDLCVVDFQTAAAQANALPVVRLQSEQLSSHFSQSYDPFVRLASICLCGCWLLYQAVRVSYHVGNTVPPEEWLSGFEAVAAHAGMVFRRPLTPLM